MKLFNPDIAIIQRFKEYDSGHVIIDIKREDLLHADVSGNKLRKLKYNILYAIEQGCSNLITYGGAFSNHIAATAAAGQLCGLSTYGIIRGEELGVDLDRTLQNNPTLYKAHQMGMQFRFVTREAYRNKHMPDFHRDYITLPNGAYMVIPEGGTNALAVKGCQEILTDHDRNHYNVICVAAGTGGTAAGIINSAASHQRVLVFSALKGDFIKAAIKKFTNRTNWEVIEDHCFGGYAKSNDALIEFMNTRFRESEIPLDPIYTAKMMYGIEQLVNKDYFNNETRILAIHTGGTQAIAGFNNRLKKKGRSIIAYENHI